MKSHIIGLYTAIYQVEDMERAKRWYSTLLGHAPYFDEPYYVGFNVAGHELGLLPKAPFARRKDALHIGVSRILLPSVPSWNPKDTSYTNQ